ncbi:MAG TPA: cytochrome c1 [Aliiroseovarius sp.]|nr:cytochrome c1 [Aliiroseovarius sp.]
MFKKLALSATAALLLTTGGAAMAGEGERHVEDIAFSFEGPFGKYDPLQLQRGLKVYTEVCAACHGLKFVPIRTLGDPGALGYTEDEVRAFASANVEVYDADLDDTRPAKPSDNFPASNDPNAPDLSLMAKARKGFEGPRGLLINPLIRGVGGPEHIYSILTGYTGEEKEIAGSVFYENTAFPGGWISMPPPLMGEDVEFDDHSSNELHAEAEDVSAFLMWTAEPKMMARKKAGAVAVLLMVLMSVLLYLTNKRLWYPIKHRKSA